MPAAIEGRFSSNTMMSIVRQVGIHKRRLHWLDISVVLSSLVLSSIIGIVFAWRQRRKQDNAEFLLGSRSMRVLPVVFSLMGTFLSATTVLGYPAEMYSRGSAMATSVISSMIATALAGEFMLPVFYRLKLTSLNLYIERRFGSSTLRKVLSFIGITQCITFMGAQLYAPAVAIEAVSGLAVPVSMLSVGVICVFYTTIGGLKAVVWTDMLQISIMFAGLLMVAIKSFLEVGDIGEVFRRLNEAGRLELFDMRVDPLSPVSFWNCFVGMGFLWFFASGTTQQQVQRYCSLPTIQKARQAVYLNMMGVAVALVLAFLSGIGVYSVYHGCDPLLQGYITDTDHILPYFVMDRIRTPGLEGLFVAAVFGGTLSTLASGFNSMSACIWDDFLAPSISRDLEPAVATFYTKLVVFAVGMLTISFGFLSAYVGNTLYASLLLSASAAGPVAAVYIVGVFVPFVNLYGVAFGLAVSIVVTLWNIAGKLFRPSLPTIIKVAVIPGCNATMSSTVPMATVFHEKPTFPMAHATGLDAFYGIHPYVIPLMAAIVVIVLSILVSMFTGGNSYRESQMYLFSDCQLVWLLMWDPPKNLNILYWLGLETPKGCTSDQTKDTR